VAALESQLGDMAPRAIRAVLDREATASTGLGDEVAVPHAAIAGLSQPVMALGFAREGVEFNAPDGRPARIVFLLLMPPRAHDQEVRILASIAEAVFEPSQRERLLNVKSSQELSALLSVRPLRRASRSSRASLADV